MRGDPPARLDYLLAYYRGVYFATVALKARLARLGPEGREGVRAVGRYQTMVERYRDALVETERMHREHQ
ncbi:MAG: hypothetical protein ACRDM0_02885 [Thermoleophilaceae bacterium]